MVKILGGLKVFLGLDATNFEKGIARTKKGVSTFKSFALQAASAVGIAFSFSAAVRGLSNFYSKLDQIGKRSSALGVSTEYYQKMEYAAERSGVAVDQIYESINRLVKFAGDFANGNAEAGKVFSALGLTQEDIKGLSPDKLLELVNGQLSKIPNNQERVALGAKLMGETYGKLTNYLRDFSALADEATAKGFIIDDAEVKRAEELQDVFTDINKNVAMIVAGLMKTTGLTGRLKTVAEEVAALAGGEAAAKRNAGIFTRAEMLADARRRIESNEELKKQYAVYAQYSRHSADVTLEKFAMQEGLYRSQVVGLVNRREYSSVLTQAEVRAKIAQRDADEKAAVDREAKAAKARKQQAEQELAKYAAGIIIARMEAAEEARLSPREKALRKALREFDAKAAALGVNDLDLRANVAAAAVAGFETESPVLTDTQARSSAILSRFSSPQRAGTVLAGSMEAYKAQFNNENNLLKSIEHMTRQALDAQQQTAQNTAALQSGVPAVIGASLQSGYSLQEGI